MSIIYAPSSYNKFNIYIVILQVLCVGHLNIRSVYSQYEENIQMYICKFYPHIICYKKGMQSQIVFKITINKN